MSSEHSSNQQSHLLCPVNCPNRKTGLGKGYSYLFAIVLTLLLAWHSFTVEYSRSEGLKLQTKDVPVGLLVGYLFIVSGALGINTDPLAQALDHFLSKGKNLG